MFRKIIVGCTTGPESRDALALASRLAPATGANLVLGYVYRQQPPWFSSTRSYQRALRSEIRGVFDPALASLPAGVNAESVAIASTSPARGLHDIAEGERADLLVIGSTHRGPVGRVAPGSVGELVLTAAPCAVAISPHGFRERGAEALRTVGAAFDGSPEAAAAVRCAHALATATGAGLRAIGVAEHHLLGGHGDRHPLADRLAQTLGSLGLDPATDGVLLDGDPVERLADAARSVDLLVVGSRGFGPTRHVLLGTVSAKLMRTAPCPLVVLPRTAEPGGAPSDQAAAAKTGALS